jgi:hypothetical protein
VSTRAALRGTVELVESVPRQSMLGYIRNMHPQVTDEELRRLDEEDLLAFKLNYCAIMFHRMATNIRVAVSEVRDALQPLVKFHREHLDEPISASDPAVRGVHEKASLHLNALTHLTPLIKENITRLENANCIDGRTAKAMRAHAEALSKPRGALSLVRSIYGLAELARRSIQEFDEASATVADELLSRMSRMDPEKVRDKPAYILSREYAAKVRKLLSVAKTLLEEPGGPT